MIHRPKSTGQLPAQQGLSLIEILVAIGISAVLLTGVIQIFISSKQSYQILEATARMQEGGRFAVDFIARDLRMAGYTGCFRGDTANIESILNTPNDFAWDLSVPLQGYEWTGAGWSPALPALISGQVREGTDVVVTRGLGNDGIHLVPPFSNSAQLFVNQTQNNIVTGDIVLVADCTNASAAQITNSQQTGFGFNLVHSASGSFTPGNSTPQFANSFGPGSEVGRIQSSVYYIGTGAEGTPALFRRALVNPGGMQAQELVDGVENLQVLYGEDLDGDGVANRYVTADAVGDMSTVASTRISLLMRTADNIASTPQTYVYGGETVTADDLRIRRAFTSTIKLRNRGPR